MKTVYVKDLTKGQLIDGESFAIYEVSRAEDKNGRPYYNLTLSDKTGRISAKIWSDNITNVDTKALKEGNLVSISAKTEEFRSNLQLNILEARSVDETAMDDFIGSSMFDADDMVKELKGHIQEIEDGGIRKVLENIVEDKEMVKKLMYWPAGRSLHHEFRSGLLQHVLEMINIAKSMQKFYPELNFDVLIAGIILHDIGKTEELSFEGISINYSKKGALFGHIVIGVQIFEKYGGKELLHEDLYLHIAHLILSHHGELQYGSPVVPATPEATALTYIDNLSSKTKSSQNFVSQIQDEDGFSGPISWLNNARLWKFQTPSSNNDEDKDQMSLV